jgi:hypothetical protein
MGFNSGLNGLSEMHKKLVGEQLIAEQSPIFNLLKPSG